MKISVMNHIISFLHHQLLFHINLTECHKELQIVDNVIHHDILDQFGEYKLLNNFH